MTIRKFSTTCYNEQSEQFSYSFDILRHSIDNLKGKSLRDFMEKMRLPEIDKLNKRLEFFQKITDDKDEFDSLSNHLKRKHEKKMSTVLPVTPTLRWTEYKGQALLAVNSGELIIRVALFEAFLKDIHRQALIAKPQLLSLCKPNRPIPLKDIFHGGYEQFKFVEIDRQVREADRLTTKEKVKFFRQRLKLPWYDKLDLERNHVKRIEELINLRHKLVHSEPNAYITDNDVKDARKLFKEVPENCVWTGTKVYSDFFSIV